MPGAVNVRIKWTRAGGVANSIVVNNASASALTNYPLQIGRPFVQGAIPSGQSPVFSDGGTAISTQSDVKNRWPDGSVKFAILSAVVPSLSASSTKTLSINAGTAPSGSGLTPSAFLAANPDFNVSMVFANGVTASVSARTMMAAGAVTSWCSGPVMTSFVVADHQTKAFDVGNGNNKSIRPIFHITKWTGFDVYRVRVITESSDTAKLKQETFSLQVTQGLSSPAQLLQTPTFTQYIGSRFSREFWFGSGVPAAFSGIRHNVGYLASTKAIPNYDPSITLSSTTINSFLSSWNAAAKGPFDPGLWNKYLRDTGGKPYIGLFPSWSVWMMYSDNATAQTALQQNLDLAASFQMHFRTGDTRVFDSVTQASGKGLPVTRDSHIGQFFYDNNSYLNSIYTYDISKFDFVTPSDTLTKDKSLAVTGNGDWVHDSAHQPDPWYLSYLLTGDYWCLEQLQFWASWGLFDSDPGYTAVVGTYSPIYKNTQLRGWAWLLRTRARAAYASVDSSPEKTYFTRATEEALRVFEGIMIGPGGASPIRATSSANDPPISPNALRYFYTGDFSSNGIPKPAGTFSSVRSSYMDSFLYSVIGLVVELGFNGQELLTWVAPGRIALGNTAGVDPRHVADYYLPCQKVGTAYFQDWPDAFSGYTQDVSRWELDLVDLDHGYTLFALVAWSYLKNEPNGDAAWNWGYTNGYQLINWASNPKMAILPR